MNRRRACEGAGREADDSFEVTMHEALIVKADARGDLRLRHSASEQVLRACDATMRDVGVWREADLFAKRSAEAELVETCVCSERVEIDRFGEALVEQRTRPRDRCAESLASIRIRGSALEDAMCDALHAMVDVACAPRGVGV